MDRLEAGTNCAVLQANPTDIQNGVECGVLNCFWRFWRTSSLWLYRHRESDGLHCSSKLINNPQILRSRKLSLDIIQTWAPLNKKYSRNAGRFSLAEILLEVNARFLFSFLFFFFFFLFFTVVHVSLSESSYRRLLLLPILSTICYSHYELQMPVRCGPSGIRIFGELFLLPFLDGWQ